MILRVGSRDSLLARRQAEPIVEELDDVEGVRADLVTRSSEGDLKRDLRLDEFDQTGVFTRDLDQAVRSGELDAAVHSLKDCPTDWPEDLVLAAVPPRATPFDMLVGLDTVDLSDLEGGTVIGTSSNRRRANLLHLNEDILVEECRGNVPTRMEKLFDEDSSYDALVLAAAGLERIGVEEITARIFRLEEMLPAAGQGALAVVARRDNQEVRSVLEELDHPPSRITVTAERTLLNRLEAGCQAPLGTLARIQNGDLLLKAQVTHPDGDRRIEDQIEGPSREAESLGRRLADRLLERGASDFIP